MSRRRVTIFAALAVTTLLLGGYTLWWFRLAQAAEDGVRRWAAGRAAQGWTVTTGPMTVSGFPFALRLTLPQPAAVDSLGNGWRGPPLTATLSPLNPTHAHLEAPGAHRLTAFGGAAVTVTVAQASADLAQGQGTAVLTHAETAGAVLDRLEIRFQRLGGASASLTVDAAGLHLPSAANPLLGPDIPAAHLDARLLGEVPNGPLPTALAGWRDQGGTLEVDALTFSWPPLWFSGKATFALDAEMQPLLAGTATARGLPQTMERLGDAGLVNPRDAMFAKLALAMVSRPGADGKPEVTVPVTIQNRRLSLGPVPLMDLPEIHW
jgi:hypothetical protein